MHLLFKNGNNLSLKREVAEGRRRKSQLPQRLQAALMIFKSLEGFREHPLVAVSFHSFD
jgi:hypothetical protein